MDKVLAPWTPEQVKELERFQSGEKQWPRLLGDGGPSSMIMWTLGHPFTCCSHNGCDRRQQPNEGALIPSTEGWTCPCGAWKQDWCHDFMCEPISTADMRELLSCPGDTLVETLLYLNADPEDFAQKMDIDDKTLLSLMFEQMPFTEEIAYKLEALLKIDHQFWLNSERNYRLKLEAIIKLENDE